MGPQKIHRESSPSYGVIPYYTYVFISKLSSVSCSGRAWKCQVEVEGHLHWGAGKGTGGKHKNYCLWLLRTSISEAELPASPFLPKSNRSPFP